MATKAKRRPPKGRPIQSPKRRVGTPQRRWWPYAAAAAGLAGLAVMLALAVFRSGSSGEQGSAGLPDTPDYHSLLVDPSDPRKLVLGTHFGLYVSSDGGRHWRFDALSGDDAMNLARPERKTIWLAGHQVFKKSSDAGVSWRDVAPAGLPSLDIHGFTVDPRNPRVLYAAVAGRGLYRSRDGGGTFALVSGRVGGSVMALAMLPDGRILAGDTERGLLESSDRGRSWRQTLRAQVLGLAVNPSDPKRILAAGAGIALSTDGGRSWRSMLDLPGGVGPVAWSRSDPSLAYAVGFDRVFYRSGDGGESWRSVEGS